MLDSSVHKPHTGRVFFSMVSELNLPVFPPPAFSFPIFLPLQYPWQAVPRSPTGWRATWPSFVLCRAIHITAKFEYIFITVVILNKYI